MGRKKKKKKLSAAAMREKRNRRGMMIITFVVCILFAVLLVSGIRMQRRIIENDNRQMELRSQIAEEEQKFAEAEDYREYVQSEEFVKETAHDKLGLLEDDEVIFKKQP